MNWNFCSKLFLCLFFFNQVMLFSQSIKSETNIDYSKIDVVIWNEAENIKELNVVLDDGTRDAFRIPYIDPKEKVIKELLEEFRYIISAIIYGYKFEYRPSYKDLNVKENYNLELRKKIKWGSNGLKILEDWEKKDGKHYFRIRYYLNKYDIKNYKFWQSSKLNINISKGEWTILDGKKGKILAIEDGIKKSILKQLKSKISTRPSLVKGFVSLIEGPQTYINNGKYVAPIKAKVDIKEVEKYVY